MGENEEDYEDSLQKTEQDIQVNMLNADLNQALDTAKPGTNSLDAVTGRIPGIGLGDSLYNSIMENPKFQAMANALGESPPLGEINWNDNFNWEPPPKVEVVIGGYNQIESSAVSVKWDSAMGYIHGLGGAQGAYDNRSDDYKFSWNLANNAMRTLADAVGKVAETAPPALPGRGPKLGMELAAGTISRVPMVATPIAQTYFSSMGNESNASKSNETSNSTENIVTEPSSAALKEIGVPAENSGIRALKGTADDAEKFFKAQVNLSTIQEVKPGVFVGKDVNGIIFTYRASSKSGPPTIDVNGVDGIRKIKFLEGGE